MSHPAHNCPLEDAQRRAIRRDYAAYLIGSPDNVAEKLPTSTENQDCTDLTVQTPYPGLDPRLANHSLELFTREVMPGFHHSPDQPVLAHSTQGEGT